MLCEFFSCTSCQLAYILHMLNRTYFSHSDERKPPFLYRDSAPACLPSVSPSLPSPSARALTARRFRQQCVPAAVDAAPRLTPRRFCRSTRPMRRFCRSAPISPPRRHASLCAAVVINLGSAFCCCRWWIGGKRTPAPLRRLGVSDVWLGEERRGVYFPDVKFIGFCSVTHLLFVEKFSIIVFVG